MLLTGVKVVLPRSRSNAEAALAALVAAPALRPFAPSVVAFVKALSEAILRSPEIRQFPEMIAFGYWIRQARLKQMADAFEAQPTSGMLTPRGVAFHIAPANVDTIFLYSLIISLLVGNRNVVRVSSKESAQVETIIGVLQGLLAEPIYASCADRLLIVRYEHSEEITRTFTQSADIRVVWGGDATVDAIRRIPLPPRSVEMTFADKVSLAVLDAGAYLAAPSHADIARNFANDAYWFGQMACSSPRVLVWLGTDTEVGASSAAFWASLERHIATDEPELQVMDFMNKLVAEQIFAALSQGRIRRGANNFVNVVNGTEIAGLSLEDHCGGGLFLETRLNTLADLKTIVNPRCQTITTYGIEAAAWHEFIDHHRPHGIDRIVPIGDALTFAAVWDGLDLFRSFCREVTIKT